MLALVLESKGINIQDCIFQQYDQLYGWHKIQLKTYLTRLCNGNGRSLRIRHNRQTINPWEK